MKNPLYTILAFLLRRLLKKPAVFGLERVSGPESSIMIANHEGFFGPVVIMLFLPKPLVPWVVYENLDVRLCRAYLRMDFVEPALGLRAPWSYLLAAMISPFCVGIMKYVDAIPVYHSSKRIVETLDLSVDALARGRNLLIFPENPRDTSGAEIKGFMTGFVQLAKQYQEKSGQPVSFIPVYVSKAKNQIRVGEKILFNPKAPYHEERMRVLTLLRQRMEAMKAEAAVSQTIERSVHDQNPDH